MEIHIHVVKAFCRMHIQKIKQKIKHLCWGRSVQRVCLKFCVGIKAMASEIYILCDLFIVYYF